MAMVQNQPTTATNQTPNGNFFQFKKLSFLLFF